MWEYKRTDYKYRTYNELVEQLNNEGKEGWEVIHYEEEKPDKWGNKFGGKFLFKRLKQNPACQQKEQQ